MITGNLMVARIKHAEELLNKSENALETLLNNLPSGNDARSL